MSVEAAGDPSGTRDDPPHLQAPRPSGGEANEGATVRIATIVWCMAAGYFLLFAPLGDIVWNDAFFARAPALQRILFEAGVRWGICVVGTALLMMAAWDITTLMRTARPPTRR